MFIAFSIALLAATIVSVLQEVQWIYYGSGLIALLVGFLIIRFLIKKHMLFPYYLILVGYSVMLTNIIVLGGTVADVTIFFFLRSEEHTSELQSRGHLVCRLLLDKK